ncbi:MAG: elongation factor Ts [Candidatus Coatesbacteria bacterium 4484_99]|uniref:Elongation factor Ts n=1 Tax=Candidatus Coatesbacteria bacterium 4484_99 TaxID=1970774 RepID=A0A1W9S0Z4_9BACT|nr:MAG: elongation factor Ts [Candidatus Coatesbacteria bacterium 4484_99]RLC42646.1 MAG: elongation factor Ts [Candidatus Coatesbacteria bacterium]RLC42855.1 MAG: elongation factor Ts [Candidatus Coatesbacteria bacterium]RLC44459.1 MAG: elongation factor Ts [Candidatus Coatesbacteria bacterium]
MMKITAEMVKELKNRTGVGLMDCKRALEEAGGDMELAIEKLRIIGLAKASKKEGRETQEGVVSAYIHPGNRLGVLVELNCETDFAARTEEFKRLAYDIAMHIAASAPDYVSKDQVPEEVLERERKIFYEQIKDLGKPDKVVEKIVEGKLQKRFSEVCLYDQPYVRDPDKTVGELIKEAISKFNENIRVSRFARFKLGE